MNMSTLWTDNSDTIDDTLSEDDTQNRDASEETVINIDKDIVQMLRECDMLLKQQ